MEKVVILSQEVTIYLNTLVGILFENEYFGFKGDAQNYVSKIYDFIEYDLKNFPVKNSPKQLQKLGSSYAFYKANQRTTWFVFFERNKHMHFVT